MHSLLLNQYLSELKKNQSSLPILDLACGNGRNGLYCLEQNLPVTFADIKVQALSDVKQTINNDRARFTSPLAVFWQVDFEQKFTTLLAENSYSALLVFRYLHRPLMEQIKAAVVPNGLVIYETFTVSQAELGRPKNPEFLLKVGELAEYFADWQILHTFEGVKVSDNGITPQAIAQIVARKPL
jgi:SAM-dependent methyltransferase